MSTGSAAPPLPAPLVPSSGSLGPVHPHGRTGITIVTRGGLIQAIIGVGAEMVDIYIAEQSDPSASHMSTLQQVEHAVFQALLDKFGGYAKAAKAILSQVISPTKAKPAKAAAKPEAPVDPPADPPADPVKVDPPADPPAPASNPAA